MSCYIIKVVALSGVGVWPVNPPTGCPTYAFRTSFVAEQVSQPSLPSTSSSVQIKT
jgi:hypothetical protein